MLKSEIFRKTPLQSSIESHKQRSEEAASIKTRINHKDLDLRSVIRDYESQHKLPRLLSPTLPPALLNYTPLDSGLRKKFIITLRISPSRLRKPPKKEALPRNGLGIRTKQHLAPRDRREVSEPPVLEKSNRIRNPLPSTKRSRTLTPDVVEKVLEKVPDQQVTSGKKEWQQLVAQAKDSKHKSDQMRSQQKSLPTILYSIDSILLFVMGFSQNDGPSLLADWNNLLSYIKHTIFLARKIHERTKEASVQTLAGLLFFLKGSVERHVLDMILASPENDIKASELHESVKKSFTEGEFLMGYDTIRSKFPEAFSLRKAHPIRKSAAAIKDYRSFYLPLGYHTDLNQVVGLGTAILHEANTKGNCGLVFGVVQ